MSELTLSPREIRPSLRDLQLRRYSSLNWGLPFVILFIVLLLISAATLSLGYQGFAIDVADYAFYSLVLGVFLQIASYVKHNEEKAPINQGPPRSRVPRSFVFSIEPKFVAIVVVTLILIGGVAILRFFGPVPNPSPIRQSYAPLSATHNSYDLLKEPDGSRTVFLAISTLGGAAPYNFSANWSDRVNQTASSGVFQRAFAAGQSVPSFVLVTVRSADGQIAKVNITISS